MKTQKQIQNISSVEKVFGGTEINITIKNDICLEVTQCPFCYKLISKSDINNHMNKCV